MALSRTKTPGTGNAFGSIPGQITAPSPFSDLSSVYPNLSGTNSAVSGDILSKLRGELSPNTINAIHDAAAEFGVSSGMPGSGLMWNKGLRDIGLSSEQMQQQGLQDYASILPAISQTQTLNPALRYEIDAQNTLNRAAPDPAAAASYAEGLFQKYLDSVGGGSSGGGGSSDGGSWWQPDFGDGEWHRFPYGNGTWMPGRAL